MSTEHAKEYVKHAKRDSGCLIWVFGLIVLTWIGIPAYMWVMSALMSDTQVSSPAETPDALQNQIEPTP